MVNKLQIMVNKLWLLTLSVYYMAGTDVSYFHQLFDLKLIKTQYDKTTISPISQMENKRS